MDQFVKVALQGIPEVRVRACTLKGDVSSLRESLQMASAQRQVDPVMRPVVPGIHAKLPTIGQDGRATWLESGSHEHLQMGAAVWP